ncbi:MAG: hypothetical protein H0W23_00715, partial [Chloroflexia bacterium]|nr:hypothetical protein [Chloroflexia bacterium]
PRLALTLTDTAFEIAQPLVAGRYEITVSNTGTLESSHFALGKIPDNVTDAQYEEWLTAITSGKDATEALSFEAIAFVGVPDWPQPDANVTGVVDIEPGRYFLFDPFSGRKEQTIIVEGDGIDVASPEPEADLTVVLREMEIVLSETTFTSKPMRWKIENTGSMSHEVAVIPVSPDFTEEHLQLLITLPEDATPPPGVPELIYQPTAAIGILAGQHTSWLDVHLKPGRYLAVCMLPFSTGYPHAMDGMYRFLDVA